MESNTSLGYRRLSLKEKQKNCRFLLKTGQIHLTVTSSPNNLRMQSRAKNFCQLGSRWQVLRKLRNNLTATRTLPHGLETAGKEDGSGGHQNSTASFKDPTEGFRKQALAQASNPSLQEAKARGLGGPGQLKPYCKTISQK